MKKNNLKAIFFISSLYIFVFQNILQKYIPIFSYVDEFYAILFIPIIILRLRKSTVVNKKDFKVFIAILIFVMIGIYSNIVYKYQSMQYILLDILACLKFFMVFYGSYILFNDCKVINVMETIKKHIKFIIICLFVLTIFDYGFHIFEATIKHGLRAENLFYNHPTALAAVCVMLLSLLYLVNEKNVMYMIMLSIIMISTLRIKAIIFVVILFLMYIYVLKNKNKIKKGIIIVSVILAIIVGYDQFNYFFIEIDNSARSSLFNTSFKIAKDYFPFGTGFGTYGSYVSGENYSPVYYKYHINDVYGLTKDKPMYVSDSFWPMILGQFGYAGLFIYICVILSLFIKGQKGYNKKGRRYYFSYMILFIYLIISSTSESAFVNAFSIPFAFYMGISLNCLKENSNEGIK